jgi:hypothetical protein
MLGCHTWHVNGRPLLLMLAALLLGFLARMFLGR